MVRRSSPFSKVLNGSSVMLLAWARIDSPSLNRPGIAQRGSGRSRDSSSGSRYSSLSDVSDTVHTYFVQPGHYLCLGDNSAQSSDGREWGTVPERLMLGRAVFVFAPFLDPNAWLLPRLDRVGFIR